MSETGIERLSEERVCAYADALQSGDEVVINDRSRTLEVLGRETQINPGVVQSTDYPYKIVWLRGNGTEYRLRYSHLGRYYPRLHTESQLVTEESYSIKHGEPRKSTRAEGYGQHVRRIKVVGIDVADTHEWALARNIMGLEDPTEVDR